jgi:hypothetical protein
MRQHRQWRAGALLAACGGFLVAAPRWAPRLPAATWTAWWSWVEADPQRALTMLAAGSAWLLAAWLLVVTALMVLATSTRGSGQAARRAAEALTPRVARGLLKGLIGAAVVVSAAGPAIAAPAPVPVAGTAALPSLAPVPAPVIAAPPLPPLLDLDRPRQMLSPRAPATPPAVPRNIPKAAVPPAAPPPAAARRQTYRVRPGDTLWGLAAARLPAGSSPTRITRAWQQWYLANRQEIGPDPNLLLVGEALAIAAEAP